jgi:phosphoglycolate phosphatase
MKQEIKAVIFDLDGTLLDTIHDIATSVNNGLIDLNIPPYSDEEYKYFVGEGVVKLMSRVLEKYPYAHGKESFLLKRYMEEYAIHQHDTTKPYDGIMDLIAWLISNHIQVAVLSNKPHIDTLRVVEHHFPILSNSYIMGKMDEFLPKPSPQSLYALLQKLNVSNDQVLYVGDTATDMITAKSGDLTAVGVTWGFRQKEELIAANADKIVDHPDEIKQFIEKFRTSPRH